MLFSNFIYTLIIIITTTSKLCQSQCNSFNNVTLELKDRYGFEFKHTVVAGCIERIEFGDTTVAEAYVKKQEIPKLGVDSVRNMGRLEVISFMECDLVEMMPAAFRNVPRLKKVQVSFCGLEKVQKGVFNAIINLEELKLSNNKISTIENQAFANLSRLKRVYGDHNDLEVWSRDWFQNSTQLVTIDFQRNKIRKIPRKAFAYLGHLKQICFDYNEIETIEVSAFEGLKYLDHLRLKHNRLKVIKEDVFPNPIKIRYLIISANYLNFLSDELLKRLSVVDILVDYNPWKCPCLDKIYYWMYTSNVTLTKAHHCDMSSVPVCASPTTYPETCLDNVDEKLTERYLGILRNLPRPLKEWCARLD